MSVLKVLGSIAGPLVKTIAPTVATALGGPLAGMATGWMAKKLLGKDNASLEDISKFIQSNNSAETLLKIKELEQEFKLETERLGIDVFELEVQDRSSAREFGIKTKIGAYMQAGIGTIMVVGFLYTVYLVLTGGIKEVDPNMLVLEGTVIGYVSAKADQVIAFLFGSTHSSGEKSEQLAQALKDSVGRNGK